MIIVLLVLLSLTALNMTRALDMDVKCAVYQQSDRINGGNVDVRTLVMGLKANTDYTAEVVPDHNPSTTVTVKTDSEGIFWIVAKVPNGEYSLLFKVNIYEGRGTDGKLVATGDDEVPCYEFPL